MCTNTMRTLLNTSHRNWEKKEVTMTAIYDVYVGARLIFHWKEINSIAHALHWMNWRLFFVCVKWLLLFLLRPYIEDYNNTWTQQHCIKSAYMCSSECKQLPTFCYYEWIKVKLNIYIYSVIFSSKRIHFEYTTVYLRIIKFNHHLQYNEV